MSYKEENGVAEFSYERYSSQSNTVDSIIGRYKYNIQNLLKNILKDPNFTIRSYSNSMNMSNDMKVFYNNFNRKISFNHNQSGDEICSFYMYNQNNCCGAMTISNTFVNSKYRGLGIGTLLQYMKEDLAISCRVSLLTCTSVYYEKLPESYIGFDYSKLKSSKINSHLLDKTGWNISNIFYNRKSKNLVGFYIKQLKEEKIDREQVMKINIKKSKLVEIKNVSIGADPELFLRSRDTGEYVPSFFIIEGGKYNPTMISDEGHNIQCDNVMVEYGIPPSKTEDEFIKNNLFVQNYLKQKVCDPARLDMVIFPAVRFDENNLLDQRAKEFGCNHSHLIQ